MGKSQPFLLISRFAFLVLGMLFGQAAFADIDPVAAMTAREVFRVEYQKQPVRVITTSVLNERGNILVVRAATSTHVCISKLEHDEDKQGNGWIVREKMCWEK